MQRLYPRKEMSEAIINQLYKGEVEVKFFPESHIYFINGKRNIGVTTFIGIKDRSHPLILWAIGLMKEYLLNLKEITADDIEQGALQHTLKKEKAATIGDEAHKWIEQYIKAKLSSKKSKEKVKFLDMPENEAVLTAVNGFIDWVKKHKVSFIDSERIVYSKKYDYSGKMDIEAIVDGYRCLVDIKTGNELYNDVRLQTAAYLMADVEESGRKYRGRWAVRIAKETEKDYIKRMEKKGKSEYKPYVAFEAKYLDENKNLKEDYDAFLSAMNLYRWDKKTDFFLNK